MKKIILLVLIVSLQSCSDFLNHSSESKTALTKAKKASSSKKITEAKKNNSHPEITGVLMSGVEYEATPELDGYVISFDPFIAKKDDIFLSTTSQIIAKLYSDKIKDDTHISIETDIDYAIFDGLKGRYRIVPFKESNGEISSISITSIL